MYASKQLPYVRLVKCRWKMKQFGIVSLRCTGISVFSSRWMTDQISTSSAICGRPGHCKNWLSFGARCALPSW
eukprot:scaffold126214_cov27-Prasinocladus_malaysianus.AAC.1